MEIVDFMKSIYDTNDMMRKFRYYEYEAIKIILNKNVRCFPQLQKPIQKDKISLAVDAYEQLKNTKPIFQPKMIHATNENHIDWIEQNSNKKKWKKQPQQNEMYIKKKHPTQKLCKNRRKNNICMLKIQQRIEHSDTNLRH